MGKTLTSGQRSEDGSQSTLQPKQQRFVDEYLKDLNGKQAAIRAGYSPLAAEAHASRMLRNHKVSKIVESRLAASTAKAQLTVERIDQEIARLAFSDVRKLFDEHGNLVSISELDDDAAASVASVETESRTEGRDEAAREVITKKLKLWDKVSALTLAAKRLKLISDRQDINVTVRLEQLIAESMLPGKTIEGETS